MTKIKKQELIKIPISRLLKIEVPRLALRVMEIVEKHNPEELHINEIFELLVAEQPNIQKLDDKPGPHPLTEDLYEFRRMRTLYIGEIRHRLKVVIKEDKSGINKDVKLVKGALNNFFNNLELCKNDEMFSQKLTQFFDAIDSNESLETAFSTLEFTKHLNSLRNVHSSIQEVLANRVMSISQRPDETTEELKDSVLTALMNLFKQIEIAPLKHTDLDYKPLFKELNQLLINYRDLINLRVLYNKRKAELKKNGESSNATTTTQLDESEGGRLSINELKSQLADMEKAVAMSSKTMQPPVDNKNEA